jgi:hypothetical protein
MLRQFRSVLVSILVTLTAVVPIGLARADTPTQPTVLSFTMLPDSVDTANQNNVVSFDLVVNNITGISSGQTKVVLTNKSGISLSAYLFRTDVPLNPLLQKVTFHGAISIPSSAPAGIYTATADSVAGLNADGSAGFPTPILKAVTTSTLLGAENSLLVRSSGNLSFTYPTFTGPTFNNLLGGSFVDPKYSAVTAPIFKVGETFKPSNYYELKVNALSLKISSSTPAVCPTDGSSMSFIAVGGCVFTVYTDQSMDYQKYQDVESVLITPARIKPTYNVGTIATQSSAVLPLKITGPLLFTPTNEIISPISKTPTVCTGIGNFITILSGGTCTLNYSSLATASFQSSDVFPLTFEVTRSPQTLFFAPPPSVALASKAVSLTATASSGQAINFESSTPTICTVSGNSLNLLSVGSCQAAAFQAGTATIAPVRVTVSILVTGVAQGAKSASKLRAPAKKVNCLKGGKLKIFIGSKCPASYKVKR